MEWQGYVRKCAEGIPAENIVICSSPQMEALYADMHPVFIGHKIDGARDCHKLRDSKKCAKAVIATERILNQQEAAFKARGLPVYRIRSWTREAKRRRLRDQVFVKYGNKINSKYSLIIHARNCQPVTPFTGDNYPLSRWNELIEKLHRRLNGISIAAVGTKKAALLPQGVEDKRGIPLSETMDLMASARLVVGPSSGPMHLASLCHTSHAVWCTDQRQPAISNTNHKRYTKNWNPFNTPVEVIVHRKGVPPSTNQIIEAVVRMWKVESR